MKDFQSVFAQIFPFASVSVIQESEDKTITTDSPVRTTEAIQRKKETDKETCHHKAHHTKNFF